MKAAKQKEIELARCSVPVVRMRRNTDNAGAYHDSPPSVERYVQLTSADVSRNSPVLPTAITTPGADQWECRAGFFPVTKSLVGNTYLASDAGSTTCEPRTCDVHGLGPIELPDQTTSPLKHGKIPSKVRIILESLLILATRTAHCHNN